MQPSLSLPDFERFLAFSGNQNHHVFWPAFFLPISKHPSSQSHHHSSLCNKNNLYVFPPTPSIFLSMIGFSNKKWHNPISQAFPFPGNPLKQHKYTHHLSSNILHYTLIYATRTSFTFRYRHIDRLFLIHCSYLLIHITTIIILKTSTHSICAIKKNQKKYTVDSRSFFLS